VYSIWTLFLTRIHILLLVSGALILIWLLEQQLGAKRLYFDNKTRSNETYRWGIIIFSCKFIFEWITFKCTFFQHVISNEWLFSELFGFYTVIVNVLLNDDIKLIFPRTSCLLSFLLSFFLKNLSLSQTLKMSLSLYFHTKNLDTVEDYFLLFFSINRRWCLQMKF
jgi:hypothetical protein